MHFSGGRLHAVFFTEVDIAGGKSRTASASLLRDCWIQASKELGACIVHNGAAKSEEVFKDQYYVSFTSKSERGTILAVESSLNFSLKIANEILREVPAGNGTRVIVVTGSLHIISMVLAALNGS